MDDDFDLRAHLAKIHEESLQAANATPHEQLERVKEKCVELAAIEGLSSDDQLVLARAFVADLTINVRDGELQRYLSGNGPEVGEPLCNVIIPLAASSGAWGDLFLDKSLNLVAAAPKVGKSALICHLYACARRGDTECLGKRIRKPWSRLIISGNDMSREHWGKILIREGLAEHIPDPNDPDAPGDFLPDPDILIWDQGCPARMNAAGIAAMKRKCLEFPDSLLLIDSLRSNVDPSIDENKAEIRGPIEQLKQGLSDCVVTIALVHHANKSVSGSTAISAAAGNNAIPSSCDGTLLLKYLTPEPASGFRSDWRVMASSAGRIRGDRALIEITQGEGLGEWIHHGDMESALQEEAVYEMEERLTSRQTQVYEHAEEIAEMDRYITVKEVCSQFSGFTQVKARKTLEQLTRKGLLKRCGTDATGSVGREAVRYAPALSALARARSLERGYSNTSNGFKGDLKPQEPSETPVSAIPAREEGFETLPVPNTPVELLQSDGSWLNGWKLHKGSTAHAVSVWRLDGNGNLTKRNGKRWGIDVRACQPAPLHEPFNPDTLDF